jgi:hypothetical protein
MTLSRPNASAATQTRRRVESYSPMSGLCATCIDGCPGFCEVGMSSYRGTEVIYPQPFGKVTAGAEKQYPYDFSYINIMGTAVGAVGIEADSDTAVFPNVDLETRIGRDGSIKMRLPWLVAGLGSTRVAKNNWDGLAIGTAISGVPLTIGENVCGMDPDSTIKDGKVVRSPDMEYRVKTYQKWQDKGYGAIIVQANVEDTRLGVQEYAIRELGVQAVELKWGQGAKDIGGEVKLDTLERALQLYERGYVVVPNPTDPTVQAAFKAGAICEFERHSRLGMVSKEAFFGRVKELRDAGAKYVSLKTGAYRPADLARAVRWACEAEVDLLTVDGAGGGTGMSPWPMMNEWGVPTLEIESLLVRYLEKMNAKGLYIPPVAIAGGFSLEDHIFKGIALGAPYVKAVAQARSPLTACMVGKTIGEMIKTGKGKIVETYGKTVEEVFLLAEELKAKYGNKTYGELPTSAIGLYTYYQRLAQGLRQLMAGERKFALEHITRDDIAALTPEVAKLTGINYIMDVDREEVEKILA